MCGLAEKLKNLMWDAQEAADREEAEKAELEAKEQAKENKEKKKKAAADKDKGSCLPE